MKAKKMNHNQPIPPVSSEQLDKIVQALNKNNGIGIGQCGVLSKKMHVYLPNSPQKIQIIKNVDAGKLFYGKTRPGQIFHLDVFHQCGDISHAETARRLRMLLQRYNKQTGNLPLPNADLFDLQTGTGGGRMTGSLVYGNKKSLKQAHKNHIHLAFALPNHHLLFLFWLVIELEKIIIDHHLELRRIEQISFKTNGQTSQMDLSGYSDVTDSKLRSAHPSTDGVSSCQDTRNDQAVPAKLNAMPASTPPGPNSQKIPPSEGMSQQTLLPLHEKVPLALQYKTPPSSCQWDGASLQNLLFQIKKALDQNVHYKKTPNTSSSIPLASSSSSNNQCACAHTLLNLQQTIHAAAVRHLNQGQPRFSISAEDLRFYDLRPKQQSELCLLLDTSASMCGWRMELTKKLSEKLLSGNVRKICCISFQGQDASIKLPFTQERRKLQQALNELHPSGATPLALGMETALHYLTGLKLRKPLVLLVTDGLPCYTSGNLGNPLEDALQIASQFKKKKIRLLLIGLNQDQGYLQQLARTAGGQSFILPSHPPVHKTNNSI